MGSEAWVPHGIWDLYVRSMGLEAWVPHGIWDSKWLVFWFISYLFWFLLKGAAFLPLLSCRQAPVWVESILLIRRHALVFTLAHSINLARKRIQTQFQSINLLPQHTLFSFHFRVSQISHLKIGIWAFELRKKKMDMSWGRRLAFESWEKDWHFWLGLWISLCTNSMPLKMMLSPWCWCNVATAATAALNSWEKWLCLSFQLATREFLLLPFPSAVKWTTIDILLLLACFFLVYNKTWNPLLVCSLSSSGSKTKPTKIPVLKIKHLKEKPKRKGLKNKQCDQALGFERKMCNRKRLPDCCSLPDCWCCYSKEREDVWQAILLLLLLGWSFLCRIAIDFSMKERKKVRKRKQINKRSAAISTRFIERQWVPSMCVDIYGAVRNIWKAAFCEGKKQHLLFLFIVTMTLLLLFLLFFTHHHSTPHRIFACYVSFTPNKLSSWAELSWACFVLPWVSVISSVEAPFCLSFQETQFGFVGVSLCVCVCVW